MRARTPIHRTYLPTALFPGFLLLWSKTVSIRPCQSSHIILFAEFASLRRSNQPQITEADMQLHQRLLLLHISPAIGISLQGADHGTGMKRAASYPSAQDLDIRQDPNPVSIIRGIKPCGPDGPTRECAQGSTCLAVGSVRTLCIPNAKVCSQEGYDKCSKTFEFCLINVSGKELCFSVPL
ncbi:hypothetical protein K402DRAFT_200038 [Aulographum hederae CBS 113979]|uniref:Carbohydrate-binding module family 19 domain-containing protein n=1 Tax=Aulographum hederae CBS 113979 TaxID=1176131 RepID=A0A6G1HBK8_9PEZI|nr:hypothetical protein K402DRAFT_200038 [Aulographum hederae CBS 113979]